MIEEKINEIGSLRKNLRINKIKYYLEKDINKSKVLPKLIKKNFRYWNCGT